ncbi:Stabilin-2 [Tolypocladium ophioglossoides CBS 100239]|uniref:Stabilin-2 n=1 Tax=Tolypocladium ophioglossoides (strain CBS 100239) TaxID=1163406 RepID=A0A0L0N2J9_TOLOC|nr:Stabilin-2 [Tolypocladium ophioglossoides CBS 100239]
MRFALAAVFGAVLTGAVVIPGLPATLHQQAPLSASRPAGHADPHDDAFRGAGLPSADAVASSLRKTAGRLTAAVDNALDVVEDARHELSGKLAHATDGHGYEKHPRLTIYELIHRSEHTTRFAKVVDEHPSIVKLLNSTAANYTLFAPTNEAFKDLPDADDHAPDKHFVEALLKYHIGLGEYPARRILSTHTIPTALDEKALDGEPQRLRTSIGLGGVTVNFYSKVVAANFEATNGIVHGVNNILVPPPTAGRLISLFPGQFSTLLLASEKTDFAKYIHSVKLVGSTVFAPTNAAFQRLGLKANAFLFNTEAGRKYLAALLRYHVSPNATLYSDAYYDKTGGDGDSEAEGLKRAHYNLPTLLGDARVRVSIVSWGPVSAIEVNGYSHVTVRDGPAKNGAIQVVDKVLIPPCKHKGPKKPDDTKDIEVEDLKRSLAPYV